MDYSLRELECFTAVAEELSFTRAARKLRLAQPPLSRHVRALEEKVGAVLFDRSGRTVTLTAAGALFREETRALLPQLARAGEAVRRFASGETTRLRIGFVSAVLGPELVGVLRRFRERHPAVRLMMEDRSPAEQLAALRRGELEGGFVGIKPRERTPGVQFVAWRTEALAAFVPYGHRLAGKPRIAVKELQGEPLVAVSGDAAPEFALLVRDLCRDAGFRPKVILESPRAQAVAVMVAAGAGIAILPESLARVVGDAAKVVPLAKVQPITHVFARTGGEPSQGMRWLLESLKTPAGE